MLELVPWVEDLECPARLPSPVGSGEPLKDLQEGKVIRAEVHIVSLAVV